MLQIESTDEMEKWTSMDYWSDVSKRVNIHDEPKYAEVAKMSKAFMCLSHGNATPERGFSENKLVLDHRDSLAEETIIGLRITKDFLNLCGDLSQLDITKRLLTLCGLARERYVAFLEQQKEAEKSKISEKEKVANDEKRKREEEKSKSTEKLKEVNRLISEETMRLRASENLLKESNQKLSGLITSRETVKKSNLLETQMVIDAVIKKMDVINGNLSKLNQQKLDIVENKK